MFELIDLSIVGTMMAITYLAEIVGELTFVSLSGQIWALPFLIYLTVANTGLVNRWVIYAVTTLLLAYPSGEFLCFGQQFLDPILLTDLFGSTPDPSRLELAKLEYSEVSNRVCCLLQHVCASEWYYLVEHLPEG